LLILLLNVVLVHPSQYTLAPPIQNQFLLHCSGVMANTIGCMQYPNYENFCLMGNFPPTKFAALWYSSKPFCSDQNISNAFTNIYLALTTNKSANNSGQHRDASWGAS